jgi:hypothetical protein
MTTYLIVGVASGILFAVLDAAINANPLARRLLEAYRPIAKTSLNPAGGLALDVVFGLVMARVFMLLYDSLPGATGLVKGLAYAGIVWFFRVVMSSASQWMMFRVPTRTHLYVLFAGLAEMVVLGALYGLTLKAW